MRPRVVLGASLLVASCTHDFSVFETEDGGAIRADASPPSTDAQPDVKASSDGALPDVVAVPCKERYGALVGYTECEETETTCRFYRNAPGTCAAQCAAAGGTCLDQDDSDGAAPCKTTSTTDTCQTVRQSGLCLCSR